MVRGKLIFLILFYILFVSSQISFGVGAINTSRMSRVSEDTVEVVNVSNETKNESENLRINRIKEQGLKDSRGLRELAKSVVDFTHKNISVSLADFLSITIFGYRIASIIIALIALLLAWIIQHYFVRFIFAILTRKSSAETRLKFSRLKTPISALIILFAVDTAILMISRNDTLIVFSRRVSTMVFIAFVCWLLQVLTDICFKIAESRMNRTQTTQNLLDLGNRICQYSLVFIALLLILESCGANINTIIASLGIGGAALAFASKDTIANFFGSISLIIDKPFTVGDTIFVANLEGKVEHIGFRSTRIRTSQRSILSIPNSVLANEIIDNWSKRNKRRVSINIGLTYSATVEQILAFVADVRKILENNPKVDNDEIRVNFSGFGESALNVSAVFYVFELEASAFSDAVEDVNIDIMRVVQKHNLSFAFPTRSLYIESLPSKNNSLESC